MNHGNDDELMRRPGSLAGAVLRDVHFWIPLGVLLAGLILLHEIR